MIGHLYDVPLAMTVAVALNVGVPLIGGLVVAVLAVFTTPKS